MRSDSRARFANLIKQDNENELLDRSINVGRYLANMRVLKKKYRRNEITLLDIYEYYRTPLPVYTSRKVRNIFITASLCLTVYLTSNITSLSNSMVSELGMNLSSATLVAGTVFVLKEIIAYAVNLRRMLSIFRIHQHISGDGEMRFKRIVRGMIKLERETHGRTLTQDDVRDIVNRERLLLLLMLRKFPKVFSPICSSFLLYVLRLYTSKIREESFRELRDEIRVVSIVIFMLSPVISIFLTLYYVARIIEKSQNNAFYVFKRMYKPAFKYFVSRRAEYPHETQRKIQRSSRYLNDYFLIKKKDYLVGICSALSFFLSCSIFFIVCLILNVMLMNESDLGKVLHLDIRLFGMTTNMIYLFYAIGGISCCLRFLNLNYTSVNRRKAFIRWCELMKQERLVGYSRNRRYLTDLMSRFFVPRLQLFAIEIVSPFVVPFQLIRLRKELGSIHTLLNSSISSQDEAEENNLETVEM